jgi:hypothetical protein
MLADGQLIKNGDGRYLPANPSNTTANSTNRPKADTYAKSDGPVSGVRGVSEDSDVGFVSEEDLFSEEDAHHSNCLCKECLPA